MSATMVGAFVGRGIRSGAAALALAAGGIACEARDEVVDEAAAAASAPSNDDYFVVTGPDPRRCKAPLCGGWFVRRLNHPRTRCADGSLEEECYVAAIALDPLGLSEREARETADQVYAGTALVKARTVVAELDGEVYGSLVAGEVWAGATGRAPAGTFFRAVENGIRCLEAPCASKTAHTLNKQEKRDVVSVELEATESGVDERTLTLATKALGTPDGLLVAGAIRAPLCAAPSGCGVSVIASEFYLRVRHTEGEGCGRTEGDCALGQFCSYDARASCGADEKPGACAYRPDSCIEIYEPVCGCDGQSYDNWCDAAYARTSVASMGACGAPPAPAKRP